MLKGIQLALSCTLAVSLVLISGSLGVNLHERTFLIKGRQLTTRHDVASQLRHFLSIKFTPQQRCHRYAVALNEFEKDNKSLNYFKMAEIATMDRKRFQAAFDKILWEELKNLYMTGIESFKGARKVNAAMVELHKCLKNDFGSRDARTLKFLNDVELQKSIEQYERITSETAELLTGQKRHPTLKLEELHKSVKNSVAKWFANGKRELPKLFAREQPQARAEAEVVHNSPQPLRQPSSPAQPEVEVLPRYDSSPEPEAQPQSYPNVHAQPKLQAQPEFQAEPEFLARPEFQTQSEAQFPPKPHDQPQLPDQKGDVPQEDSPLWSKEEANLLNQKIEALLKTYYSLPLDTPLAETCRTYSKVVSGDAKAEEAPGQSERDGIFVPAQSERANFIFVLQMVQPVHGAEGLWLDMAYCARQWQDLDDDVKEYFNSAEYLEAMDKIKLPDSESAVEPAKSESVDQPKAV